MSESSVLNLTISIPFAELGSREFQEKLRDGRAEDLVRQGASFIRDCVVSEGGEFNEVLRFIKGAEINTTVIP